MKRVAFASSVIVILALGAVTILAQAQPAQAPAAKATAPAPPTTTQQAPATKATTPTTQQAPAAPAKFIKPLKGTADIQFMEVSNKRTGNEIVTVLKIKNMSNAPISLLKVDEYLVQQVPASHHRRYPAVSQAVHAWRGHRDHVEGAVQG